MTPADLREARHRLGLSQQSLARILQVSDGRTVRRWEAGDRDIPGPVQVLVRWLAWGEPPVIVEPPVKTPVGTRAP